MADVIPPRRDEALSADGVPTLRFSEYLEGLTRQTNDNTSSLTPLTDTTALSFVFIENRIGSGDALTSDETGFTVDSDKLTVDMDEA